MRSSGWELRVAIADSRELKMLSAKKDRGENENGARKKQGINKQKKKKKSASSVNRTRASSMATMNSTTRPMMLVIVFRVHL